MNETQRQDFSALFMLKEAFHSEKMEGVIPERMTFKEYVVKTLADAETARRRRNHTIPRNEDSQK